MEGHFQGDLKAVCVHPRRQECFTAGEDQQLIHWDFTSHRKIKKEILRYGGECVAIDRFGKMLAVGLRDGSISLYNPDNFNLLDDIYTYCNPDKSVISVIRFTPNGEHLVVAYSPPYCEVVIYNVNDLKSYRKMACGHARVLAMDFSEKGDFALLNSRAW